MRIERRLFRSLASLAFGVASILAVFASPDSLVFDVAEDGTPEFYRDISGSMSGQNEYLAFVILLLPSAIVRFLRAFRRPWLAEIVLFLLVVIFLGVAVNNVGLETIALTLEAGETTRFVLMLTSTVIAILIFLLLSIEGWLWPDRDARA